MAISTKRGRLLRMYQRPRLTDEVYLVLKPLSRQLLKEAERLKQEGRKEQVIIDIGCGIKPYEGHFASFSRAYLGVDIDKNSPADIFGSSDNLPLRDASADIAICTQLLEHSEHPDKVLSEIRRILKPGGTAFLSTHGVYIYHPAPGDYWRWTHEGLRLAAERAGLEAVRVLPNGGPVACLSYIVVTMSSIFSYRSPWFAPARWLLVPFLNFIGEGLDNLFFGFIYPKSRLLLVANYLMVLRRPADKR